MKIKVCITLDVDPDAWMSDFGIDRDEVRDDVRAYFTYTCEEQLERIGCAMNSNEGTNHENH